MEVIERQPNLLALWEQRGRFITISWATAFATASTSLLARFGQRDSRGRDQPLADYVDRIVHLWQSRGIIPTAELVLTQPFDSVAELHTLASRICKLISVAAGSVVEWIQAEGFDPQSQKTYRFHGARATKPFCSFPTVPIKELSYQANGETLRFFLQSGLARFAKDDPQYLNGLIGAFLDARLEDDYLEGRGVKTAVALEILKNPFAERFTREHWDKVMPKTLRKEIVKVAVAAVDEKGMGDEVNRVVRETLNQLARPSLGRMLSFMIEALDLAEEDSTVAAATAIRNRLVHTGQFLSHSDADKAKKLSLSDAVNEFYVMSSFLDRLLLRFFGYAGWHIDYSRATSGQVGSVIKELPLRRNAPAPK